MEGLLSIIIPVYNEADTIEGGIKRTRAVLENNQIPHHFILIDDGSRDKTWEALNRLAGEYDNITSIRLSRNFGKESALCAGLNSAIGDCAIIMDADMQHPPESIPQMYELWKQGYEVIEGKKKARPKESSFNRLGATLFYKTLKALSNMDLENASDFKLLDKKVIEAWRAMPERNTFFRAMSHWVGFSRTTVMFSVGEREAGTSGWSMLRLMRLALNAITSFTAFPLQIVTMLGFILFLSSLIIGLQTLYMYFWGNATSGFTTVIILLLMIGSIIMMSLGIIGIYIAKIYDEVKARPRYIIAETKNKRS